MKPAFAPTEKPRIVTARFVGQDGSLGYMRGHVYDLRVHSTERYPVVIRRSWGGGYCPYSSWDTFLRNWELVE